MRKLASVVGSLLIVLNFTVLGFGQTSKGTIAGTVTDPSNAVVAGATIVAQDKRGAETRTVVTGANGEFRIEAITPSIYSLTVTVPNFAKLTVDDVDVKASVVTSVNPQLQVGSAQETVLVEASALSVQTESAELSKNISAEEITNVPVLGFNAISLVLTEPGVVSVSGRDDFTNGVSFAVDGLRPRSNNFLIDGFDNNDYGIQGQALQPGNLEAVKEVSVQTNSYSAEFGRGGASVTNVIYDNGTNKWHGGVWETYAGATLDALTAEQHTQGLTRVPQYVNNIFGFKLGGPLVHNKLFVFGSTQWNRFFGAETGSQIFIPTANGLAALQSVSSNQHAQILLNSLTGVVAPPDSATNPATHVNIGTRAGCAADPCIVELNSFQRTAQDKNPSYEYYVRADFTPTERDTFYVRFIGAHSSLSPDLFANTNGLPGTDTEQGGPSRNLGVNWTHVYNPRMINELRFTGQTIDFDFSPTAQTAASPFASLPDIEVEDLQGVDFGGVALGFPQFRNHQVFQYQDAFSWAIGRHSFKMGADIAHLQIVDSVPFNSRGTLVFNKGGNCGPINGGTCSALANYLDDFTGQTGTASRQFGIPQVSFGQTTQAYYFNDSWKLLPNLTLTYGVRYEYQGTPLNALPYPAVNESGAQSKYFQAAFDPFPLVVKEQPDRNNFGPRVGISYSPQFWTGLFGHDQTVIRAGFGAFYDTLFANILDNSAASTPNVTGKTTVAPGSGRGTPDAFSLIPTMGELLQSDAVTAVAANLRNPLTYQWNLNVERQLPAGFLATVAYVGTRGERLFMNHELNPAVFDPNTFQSARLNPNAGPILVRTNHGDSIYHGLQVDVNRRFRNGLLFRAAYTYSRSLDNGSEVFVTSGGSTRMADAFDFRSDRGPSAFDRNQRAVFTLIYQTPSFSGWSGFAHGLSYLARDWQVAGTAAFESGAPETIHVEGFDANQDASAFNDRPFEGNKTIKVNQECLFSGDPTCSTGVGFTVDGVAFGDLTSQFDNDTNFNPIGPASDFRYYFYLGKKGDVSRNSFYNPGRQDYTAAIARMFRIPGREGQELEFRTEMFNPFNHANFGGGRGGVSSVSGDLLNPNFMNVDVTREGGRSVRFRLKYTF